MNIENDESPLLRHSDNMSELFRINLILFTLFNSALVLAIDTTDLGLSETFLDPLIAFGLFTWVVSTILLAFGIVLSNPTHEDGSGAFTTAKTANNIFRFSIFLILISILAFLFGLINAYLTTNLEGWDVSQTLAIVFFIITVVGLLIPFVLLYLKPVYDISHILGKGIIFNHTIPKLKKIYTISPYMAHTKLDWLDKNDIFLLKHLLEEGGTVRIDNISTYSSKDSGYVLDRLKILEKHGLVELDRHYHVKITEHGELFASHQYAFDSEYEYADYLISSEAVGITVLLLLVVGLIYYSVI